MAKDPYRYFRVEARELLDQLAKSTLELEKDTAQTGSANTEHIARLLRLAHTLKGAARVVKQAHIADLAHRIEDILIPYREGGENIPREKIDGVLSALDACSDHMQQLPAPNASETFHKDAPVGTPAVTAAAATEPAAPIAHADLLEVDVLLDGLNEIGSELTAVRHTLSALERLRNMTAQLSIQGLPTRPIAQPGILPGSTQLMPQQASSHRTLLDDIHKHLTATERGLQVGIERIERELRQATAVTERLRLTPVAAMFNALERTIRDAAHGAGKKVDFHASGGDVRIDSEMLANIQSALIQIARNAIAHGIETPHERNATGKPETGVVKIEVSMRGYSACFRCSDDGRGVDLEAVRRTASARGSSANDMQQLDAAQLLAMLLKGGISTSAAVTQFAGRGVGLDLVRDTIRQLNGEVVAETIPGRGTSIELRLPLSLTAFEVLLVESKKQVAALPLQTVRSTMRISRSDIVHTQEGQAIVYDDILIPFVPLTLIRQQSDKRNGPGDLHEAKTQTMTAVIIKHEGSSVALAVDRLRGTQTIVLRPLPALAPADPIILGTYLDIEGKPCIVLDPAQLATAAAKTVALPEHADNMSKTRPILIVDDSLTTRMLESSILESAGFIVEQAASAEEGLDMARRNAYALFLVDVEMPGMDGFGFVASIRADPALCKTPCILVTSCNTPAHYERGKTVGANAYIVKSEFDQMQFLQHVTTLIQQ